MGWDFYTYESQPFWFIQEVSLIMFHETQAEQRQAKAQQAQAKRRR